MRAIPRIVFCCRRFRHGQALFRIAACAVMAAAFSAPQFASATNTSVRLITSLGTIDLQLYDDQAPITVANFLRYAGRGYYSTITSSGITQTGFFYRSVPGFVLQTGTFAYDDVSSLGGYTFNIFQHPADPPILNEFSASRSNVTGTIAMAKVSGDPNSATGEWFINLANNSSIIDPNTGQQIGLDYRNGGFTVFGNIIDTTLDPGMTVVNAIANLHVLNESGADALGNPVNYPILDGSQYLTNTPWCSAASQPCTLPTAALGAIPVNNYDTTIGLDPSNLVFITSIPNVRSTPTIQGSGQFSGPGNLLMTFTADVDMTFVPGSVSTFDANTTLSDLAQFTPPPGSITKFNDGIFQFTVTWTQGSNSRIITLHNDDPPTANHYYAYGPTSDNPAPHWYDFTYDGTTGAEVVGGKILLHFVDGQRGDDDLTANGSITHTGAPALLSVIPNTTKTSVGCSIAATPSQMSDNGDWIVVAMFLAFVALVRRRNRLDRIQRVRNSVPSTIGRGIMTRS